MSTPGYQLHVQKEKDGTATQSKPESTVDQKAKLKAEFEKALAETTVPDYLAGHSAATQQHARRLQAASHVERPYFDRMIRSHCDVETFRLGFEALKIIADLSGEKSVTLRLPPLCHSTGVFNGCHFLYECLLASICCETTFYAFDDRRYKDADDKVNQYLGKNWKTDKQKLQILIEGGFQETLTHIVDEAEKVFSSGGDSSKRVPKAVMDFIKAPKAAAAPESNAVSTAVKPS